MLSNSLKKMLRLHDPIFVATPAPDVFDITVTPYYLEQGKEKHLTSVVIARVKIVPEPENSDTHFTRWNEETLSSDVIYVKFV